MAVSRKQKNSNEHDIAVIGGGPAGMMAAGLAATSGGRVVLLEKNKRLGIKLLATGGGRCNLANDIENPREFIERIGRNGKFLFSSLNAFGAREAKEFFESRGVPLKTEASGRIFPKSDRAADILGALTDFMDEGGVAVRFDSDVVDFIVSEKKIVEAVLADGARVRADKYIICTGGKSYPQTGSNGSLFALLESLGHHVIAPQPVLTPLIVAEKHIKSVEGVSLPGVGVSVLRDGKKTFSIIGDIIFTADGLSGPVVLDASRKASIGDIISLDLFPDKGESEFYSALMEEFRHEGKRQVKNILEKKLPSRLASLVLFLTSVDGEKKSSAITRDDCLKLVKILKGLEFLIAAPAGFDKAMVTAGGVDLAEVDPKTMQSKIIYNLYFAGEVLDLDGPTGGFNLQICWTTGNTAGESAAK